jgi:hypothetical protein
VDHVVGVGVRHRLADLLERRHEPPAALGGVGAAFQQVLEGVALDQLHGQERPAVGEDAEVVHGRDVGVLQLPGDAGLVGEPPGRPGVGRALLPQHLDRDLAAQHGVGGAVDGAHAAAGDLLAEQVPRGRVRHPCGNADSSGTVNGGQRLVACCRGLAGPRRVK